MLNFLKLIVKKKSYSSILHFFYNKLKQKINFQILLKVQKTLLSLHYGIQRSKK
jgi:hypothetical protein